MPKGHYIIYSKYKRLLPLFYIKIQFISKFMKITPYSYKPKTHSNQISKINSCPLKINPTNIVNTITFKKTQIKDTKAKKINLISKIKLIKEQQHNIEQKQLGKCQTEKKRFRGIKRYGICQSETKMIAKYSKQILSNESASIFAQKQNKFEWIKSDIEVILLPEVNSYDPTIFCSKSQTIKLMPFNHIETESSLNKILNLVSSKNKLSKSIIRFGSFSERSQNQQLQYQN